VSQIYFLPLMNQKFRRVLEGIGTWMFFLEKLRRKRERERYFCNRLANKSAVRMHI